MGTQADLAERSRAVTHDSGRLPDFIIMGAAKAGTTTLHRYLLRHPGVLMSDPKEPEFFSRDEVYSRGVGWYRSLFEGASPTQLCGEASTTYTRWPHTADAAPRIAETLPEVRLIYILRNPVDRAYSHYSHHMREGVTKTFEEALAGSSIYFDCGLYMAQLERHLKHTSRERVLCLFTEDLQRAPGETMRRLLEFVGAEPLDLLEDGDLRENASGSEHFVRARTTQRLRRLPGGQAIADALPKGLRKQMFSVLAASPFGKRLRNQFQLPPMKPETREGLIERYREPNRRLAEFLGKDLSHWSR